MLVYDSASSCINPSLNFPKIQQSLKSIHRKSPFSLLSNVSESFVFKYCPALRKKLEKTCECCLCLMLFYCHLSSKCFKIVLVSQKQGKKQLINLRLLNNCLITGQWGEGNFLFNNMLSDILYCHQPVLRNSRPSHVLSH